MHSNHELIDRFYSAFARGDHETMAACYADKATFSDPVFQHLDADQVRAMWRMFCSRGSDVEVTYDNVQADDSRGSARWLAVYEFPKTGRRVHNRITASFDFEDGHIARHVDTFDLYRWTRMALGSAGTLLGWTPMVKNQVRAQAMAQLNRFRAAEATEPSS